MMQRIELGADELPRPEEIKNILDQYVITRKG